MKLAFEGIGSLSMSTIDRLRIIKRKEVDALIASRSAREDRTPRQENTHWDDVDLEGVNE